MLSQIVYLSAFVLSQLASKNPINLFFSLSTFSMFSFSPFLTFLVCFDEVNLKMSLFSDSHLCCFKEKFWESTVVKNYVESTVVKNVGSEEII